MPRPQLPPIPVFIRLSDRPFPWYSDGLETGIMGAAAARSVDTRLLVGSRRCLTQLFSLFTRRAMQPKQKRREEGIEGIEQRGLGLSADFEVRDPLPSPPLVHFPRPSWTPTRPRRRVWPAAPRDRGFGQCHTLAVRPRYSRGRSPHNPGFLTVMLPGFPGYALYPSTQVALVRMDI